MQIPHAFPLAVDSYQHGLRSDQYDISLNEALSIHWTLIHARIGHYNLMCVRVVRTQKLQVGPHNYMSVDFVKRTWNALFSWKLWTRMDCVNITKNDVRTIHVLSQSIFPSPIFGARRGGATWGSCHPHPLEFENDDVISVFVQNILKCSLAPSALTSNTPKLSL